MFGANLRPHRLHRYALLGGPGERNVLCRAPLAAEPWGEEPPARPGGGTRRRGKQPLSATHNCAFNVQGGDLRDVRPLPGTRLAEQSQAGPIYPVGEQGWLTVVRAVREWEVRRR